MSLKATPQLAWGEAERLWARRTMSAAGHKQPDLLRILAEEFGVAVDQPYLSAALTGRTKRPVKSLEALVAYCQAYGSAFAPSAQSQPPTTDTTKQDSPKATSLPAASTDEDRTRFSSRQLMLLDAVAQRLRTGPPFTRADLTIFIRLRADLDLSMEE